MTIHNNLLSKYIKGGARIVITALLPLPTRKVLAVWLSRQNWLSRERRSWWSQKLIRDWARTNGNEFHKFLWSHHIGYADTYEIGERFGAERMSQSR